MKEKLSIEFENDAFIGWIDESIAIVKVKCNAFYSLINIDISRNVLNWFDTVSEYDDINVILLLNEKGCFGNTAYEVFVTELTGKDMNDGAKNILSEYELIQVRSKEINILNSFIRATVNFKKLVISGLNGTIVTPFFGASLASNFRFATEDSKIAFSHVKYGIHASGALPFLLPKYIGIGKATGYIIEGGELSVQDAYKLGLISKIFPSKNFESECIKEAKRLSSLGSRYLSWTKHLLIQNSEELINYLRDEEKYVDKYKSING